MITNGTATIPKTTSRGVEGRVGALSTHDCESGDVQRSA